MASVANDLDERQKRQRSRNRALMIVLAALVVLFYLLGMFKFGGGQ